MRDPRQPFLQEKWSRNGTVVLPSVPAKQDLEVRLYGWKNKTAKGETKGERGVRERMKLGLVLAAKTFQDHCSEKSQPHGGAAKPRINHLLGD